MNPAEEALLRRGQLEQDLNSRKQMKLYKEKQEEKYRWRLTILISILIGIIPIAFLVITFFYGINTFQQYANYFK